MRVEAARSARQASRHIAVVTLPVLALALAVVLVACAGPRIVFEDSRRPLDAGSAKSVLDSTDTSIVAHERVADGSTLRHDALTSLRAQGAAEASAADLITRAFPADTRAVPARVVTVVWEERPALAVIEAWGKPSGLLEQKRLWVLDASSGAVLYATASR